MPLVRTSAIEFEKFDYRKIYDSLVKETSLSPEQAMRIAKETFRRLKSMNLKFLSGPLIREVVCSVLLEHGLEKARAEYTRLGLPVYDVRSLLVSSRDSRTVCETASSSVLEQYVLLNVLPPEVADAHIAGRIHIHALKDLVVKPLCHQHDFRSFLKEGLKLGDACSPPLPPPEDLKDVISVLTWLLLHAKNTWSFFQGFNHFNVLLAPFVADKDYSTVLSFARQFFKQAHMLFQAEGVRFSVTLDPFVPEELAGIPAVLPGGVESESKTYGDFVKEARTLFKAFLDAYREGIKETSPYCNPLIQIRLEEAFLDEEEDLCLRCFSLASQTGNPVFVNRDSLPAGLRAEHDLLHAVSLNLPRLALEARGDFEAFLERVEEHLELCKKVLEIKKEAISRSLRRGTLPFFEESEGTLHIIPIGLHEAIRVCSREGVFESEEAKRMAERTLEKMSSLPNGITLSGNFDENASYRLAILDLRTFGEEAPVQGDKMAEAVYYSEDIHVPPSAPISLERRVDIESRLSRYLKGGGMFHVWLKEPPPPAENLLRFSSYLLSKGISYVAFTRDLTFCTRCRRVSGGLHSYCPKCGAPMGQIEWFSRSIAFYGRVREWNRGRRAELLDRQRYSLSNSP